MTSASPQPSAPAPREAASELSNANAGSSNSPVEPGLIQSLLSLTRGPPSSSTGAPTSASANRHRLLPTVEMDAIRGRIDDDGDWDELSALAPIAAVVAAVVALAFVLWPIVSFDPAFDDIVPGGAAVLVGVNSKDFTQVAVNAELLVPALPSLKILQLQQEVRRRNTPVIPPSSAAAYVFYNNPPVAIPAQQPVSRNLTIALDNHRDSISGKMESQFSALRFDVVQGSNVSVVWDFPSCSTAFHPQSESNTASKQVLSDSGGLSPWFVVLRGETGFRLWRDDATSEQTRSHQVHSQFTARGFVNFSNLATESYYFVFSAPPSFWSFEANGTARFDLDSMEYDVSGTVEGRPKPLMVCEFPVGVDALQPSQKDEENALRLLESVRAPSTKRTTTVFYEIFHYFYTLFVPSASTPRTSPESTFASAATSQSHAVLPATRPCQILLPDPKFVPKLYLLLTAPPATPGLEGGSGQGNRHNPLNNPRLTDAGTLDPHATVFRVRPLLRDEARAGPVWFFVWAFCAVVGISVSVALAIFACVWCLGAMLQVFLRALGYGYWLDGRRRGDGDQEGVEPLPMYRPRGSVDDGGVDAPEYRETDPLLDEREERR
ncbi:hypothetical protein BC830DRAFT_1158661 [Chytriomyces sp. MP71]|nr:hypothetical protein BC830DRAFT_1158661 [Chytriomyces sp. MP71]